MGPRSLHNRLSTHIADDTKHASQSSKVQQALTLNGYPKKYSRAQQ